jgi:simple sugar transport system permease protein
VLAFLGTLVVMALLVVMLGSNPIDAGKTLVTGSLGNTFNLSQTLVVVGILTLVALAAAIPFSARLWNIGGEGQMTAGAVAAAVLGVTLPATWPTVMLAPAVTIGAIAAGSLWAAIPGWLKARFDASEIVTTLMLNFVATFFAAWIISDVFPEGFVQRTESIAANAEYPRPWDGWLVDIGIFLAIAAAIVAFIAISRSRLGFSIRAIGANARTSRLAGIETDRVTIQTFVIAGAFAGLAGALIVQGRDHSLLQNFSANFGFVGIGVALVARLKPLWIIPSAAFFAMLRVGSNSLQAGAGLAPVVGEIIVAVFVILLMVGGVIKFKYPESPDAH